jgi:hypothetical protein
MKYESNNIISRIEWCRLQQRLDSVTMDERAGWRAEEAGLMDALDRRDRRVFMKAAYPSQFIRYQCGLEDGRALLRLSRLHSCAMTSLKGLGSTPLPTPGLVDRSPTHPSSHVQVGRAPR